MATAQAAFLRGINITRNNRIAMADLRRLVTDLGYDDVRTHLQSGNVIYRASVPPARAAAAIEKAVEAELGLRIPVVARTRKELAAVVAADPLGDLAPEKARYLVVFLGQAPEPGAVARVVAAAGEDERVVVRGRELYAWMGGGVQSSKVGLALQRGQLGVVWTGRNWNTVTKVLELMG